MPQLITIFGATGNQGGSIIKEILADHILSNEFKIRGVTRDVSAPAAQALQARGIELVQADMGDAASVSAAVKGSHTVFLVTKPAYGTGPPDAELINGKNVTDACKNAGVHHLIFSSLLHVTNASGGRLKHVPHFDHKAEVEEYIRASGVPATFILPGYFMTNYTAVGMLKKDHHDGVYTLAYPVSKDTKIPLLDCNADMGKYVVACMKQRSKVLGAQVLATVDYYTPSQLVAEFEEVTSLKARFKQVDPQTYKDTFPIPGVPEPMLVEMLETHLFLETPGYYAGQDLKRSLDLLAAAGLKPTTWREFLEKNAGSFA